MTEVISVKFKSRGKAYYFDPAGVEVPDGAQVIVETSKGLEMAECVKGNHYVADERIVPPLRPLVRIATDDDRRVAALCKQRESEAFGICEKKIAQHGLDMKLVDVECNFEGNKILFFFTSDGRVDFRELVKDLAGVFRTRIELRQIGVRDEAKMRGGLGICGRPLCCSQFLDDFQPVSTKMAKTQSLSLNPAKISGTCGRLMCCLRYEQEAYEAMVKTVPKNGAFVETPDGYGNVAQVNLLRQKVKVNLDNDGGMKGYDADEVAAVPGGRPKPGETPPHVLQIKAKPAKEETPDDETSFWRAPLLFGETEEPEKRPAPSESVPAAEHRQSRRRKKKPASAEVQEKRPQTAEDAEKHIKAAHTREGAETPAGEKPRRQQNRRSRGKKPGAEQTPRQTDAAGKAEKAQPRLDKPARAAQTTRAPKPQGPKPVGKPPAAPQSGTDEAAKKRPRRRHYGKGKPGGGGAPSAPAQ